MATPKHPSVSVVIPVYNESRRLARCLDALSRQTRAPDEIIVVDNNSTDDSVEIARRYPLVRIITEKKQGITHARSAGFDTARSDVIARIDADSVVRSDWVQTLHQIFADETVDAATGTAGVAERNKCSSNSLSISCKTRQGQLDYSLIFGLRRRHARRFS